MNLSNAVALVTGGSGGLGSRICSLLAAEGVDVAVGYLGGEGRAGETKNAIEALGRKACIVNIGSTLGHGDWYADRPFAPSKAAIVPLTRFLAASLAPDVTVNCVAPGLMVGTALGSGGPQHLYDGCRNRAALGITTSLEDVAGQVVYLCKTSSITGQSVVIDGGINFH